jgi:hypothetical protein
MSYKTMGLSALIAAAVAGAVVYASNNVAAVKFLGGK